MRNSVRLSVAPLLVTSLLLMERPIEAQAAASAAFPEDVAAQLVKLNATLEDIQALLAEQLETQTLDLFLKRAQLVSSEVARLDGLLRSAQRSRGHWEDERIRLDTRMEVLQNESPDLDDEAREREMRHVRSQSEGNLRRLRRNAADIVELETRLARRQQDLEDWQELLDKRLGGS